MSIATSPPMAGTTSGCSSMPGPNGPSTLRRMLDYLHNGLLVPDLAATARRLQDLGFAIFWMGGWRQTLRSQPSTR